MQVFSQEWFECHQEKLLWLLNHPILGRWFKWVLCIRKGDIGHNNIIIHIYPDAYTVFLRRLDEEHIEVATDFRTHDKFAKRLYYAFKEFWWLAHFWDWAMADRWVPQLSFGFNTLTVFPETGNGIASFDGQVSRTGVTESFTTIRNGLGNNVGDDAFGVFYTSLTAANSGNNFTGSTVGECLFNTSSLTTVAIITQVRLFISIANILFDFGPPIFQVAAATPASLTGTTSSDYTNRGHTSFGDIGTSIGRNYMSMNEDGTSQVQKTGTTAYTIQHAWDINDSFTGSWVSLGSSLIGITASDAAGVSSDPALVVTYSFPNRIYVPNIRPRFFRPGFAR